jgi:hypothetical protein
MLAKALLRRRWSWHKSLPSHAGDGAIESCWRCNYRGDVSRGVKSLLSHAGDGAAETTWPWHDVAVESY